MFNLNPKQLVLFLIINASMYFGEEILDMNTNDERIEGNITEKGGTRSEMHAKVVGGVKANIEDYPHSVFLTAYCSQSDDEFWTCGSSVLNDKLLLSAGHCVEGCLSKFRIDALAGATDYEEARVMRQVRRYVLHADYNADTVFSDISLLYLNKQLPLGKYVQRVIIRPTFPSHAEANLAGWGSVDEKRTTTSKLKAVKQKVWTFHDCSKYERMLRGTICASSGSRHDYPYAGDSGSALITKDNQAIGLVSYRDDSKPELIVYTNVSYFYHWISHNSHALHCLHSSNHI